MKLSKTMKKAIAYICAIAMVVGSLTIYKVNSVSAAPDYSGLEGWVAIGNDTFNPSFKGAERTFYDGNCNLPDFFFQSSEILFIAGPSADQLKATLNGIEGEISAAQIHFNACSTTLIYEYNVLEISWNGGKVTVIIHCPKLEGTYEPGKEPETTEKPTDPSGHSWTNLEDGFSYEKGDNFNVVSIQQPGFATERGIYITISGTINRVTVNGTQQTDDKVNGIQGGGVCVYLSNLTKKINTVVIEYTGGTATITIQNINGTDDGEEPTTPGGTTQPENELVPEDLVEATKEAPARSDGLAYADEHKVPNISFTKDTWYKATVSVTSTVDREIQFRFQDANWDYRDITTGEYSNDELFKTNSTWSVNANETKEIVYIFQSKMTTTGGIFDICFGYVNKPVEAGSITFKNVSLTTYSSQEEAEEAAGYLDVSKYQEEVPTSEGELFAGWYSNPGYTTPYTEKSGKAYAKFIDEKVLEVCAQITENADSIRFVSTTDGLDYSGLGFHIEANYNNKSANKDVTLNSVFEKLTSNGVQTTFDKFSTTQSKYFFAYAITGMEKGKESTWTVTPFWTTEDGTKVSGTQKTFTISAEGALS